MSEQRPAPARISPRMETIDEVTRLLDAAAKATPGRRRVLLREAEIQLGHGAVPIDLRARMLFEIARVRRAAA